MRNERQELKAVLLFVLLFFLLCQAGCARREADVYIAGPAAGPETEYSDGAGTGGHLTAGAADSAGSDGHLSAGATDPGFGTEQDGTEGEAAETEGYVYVCGAVCQPGVYPFRQGMRVFEAIRLAGGFAAEADEEWLNQAGYLQDGQQLYVYSKTETQQMKQSEASRGADTAALQTEAAGIVNGKVNLNTADVETLMTLPGIGEVKAEAIVQYRTEHGAFSSIEEIQNIPGIKQAVFSNIADRITI